jgi:hypothetical protein
VGACTFLSVVYPFFIGMEISMMETGFMGRDMVMASSDAGMAQYMTYVFSYFKNYLCLQNLSNIRGSGWVTTSMDLGL